MSEETQVTSTDPSINKKKRLAETQQRREDVEKEEEEETPPVGTWQPASQQVLASRKFIKLKKKQGSVASTETTTPKLSIPVFTPNPPETKPETSESKLLVPNSSAENKVDIKKGNEETQKGNAEAKKEIEEKTEVGTFVVIPKETNIPITNTIQSSSKSFFGSSTFSFDTQFKFASSPFLSTASSTPSMFSNTSSSSFGGNTFNFTQQNKKNEEEGGEGEGEGEEEKKVEEKSSFSENSVTGEEDEKNLASLKAKLYIWEASNTKWKERSGEGLFRFNIAKDESFSRIIYKDRLGKILLNFRIFAKLVLKGSGKGSVSFVAPCVEDQTPKNFLVKSLERNQQDAEQAIQNLIKQVNAAIEKVKNKNN